MSAPDELKESGGWDVDGLEVTPRETEGDLEGAIRQASASPLIDALLSTCSGILWVLDAERRIVAINRTWLDAMGVQGTDRVLGLRPGDALHCAFAASSPAGCGSSVACTSCGTALAIVGAQRYGTNQQAECVLTVQLGGEVLDFDMRVRACPIQVEGKRMTLLFMDDVSAEQRRASLERAFFHDVNNLSSALTVGVELLEFSAPEGAASLVADLRVIASRLSRELAVQRALALAKPGAYPLCPEAVLVDEMMDEVVRTVVRHPAAAGVRITRGAPCAQTLWVDRCLIERVLLNLLLNAVEAAARAATPQVVLETARHAGCLVISVWNDGSIPREIQPRLFQRYFSTKSGAGRGQGLFSVKLFVEEYMKGAIAFSSGESQGTTFCITLPNVE